MKLPNTNTNIGPMVSAIMSVAMTPKATHRQGPISMRDGLKPAPIVV